MEHLLFLPHRIPMPPDKGEKIRAYHVLRHLSQRFKIHLGCFFDEAEDRRYVADLEALCESVCCLPLPRLPALLRGGVSLMSGRSLTEGYFHDPRMEAFVRRTITEHNPSAILAYCSAMAPYALPYIEGRTALMDFVDLDSEKWLSYSQGSFFPLNVLYHAEYRAVRRLEIRAAGAFDRSFFTTAVEADALVRERPDLRPRIDAYGNGVDLDFFAPSRDLQNPYDPNRRPVAFVGRMDYPPNVQGALWFAREVLPLLREKEPRLEFWIVGANPSAALQKEAGEGIRLTGRVADVRPYVAHAECIAVPLKIARGIQNKVLEAMAMGKPVVATSQACTGLNVHLGEDLLCADGAQEFADAVLSVLSGSCLAMGAAARARMEAEYRWPRQLAPLLSALDGR